MTRFAMAVTVLALALGSAGEAGAVPMSYTFTASDAQGQVLRGRLGYDTETPPSYMDTSVPVAEFSPRAAYPMSLELWFGDYYFSVVSPRPAGSDSGADFFESVVVDSSPGDVLATRVYGYGGSIDSGFAYEFQFLVSLYNDYGNAWNTHLSMPGPDGINRVERGNVSLDLVVYNFNYGESFRFHGRIDTLFVPEPSTLALCALAVPLGVGLWAGRRRRAA